MQYTSSGNRHVLMLGQNESNAVSTRQQQTLAREGFQDQQDVTLLCALDNDQGCPMTCKISTVEQRSLLGELTARNMVVVTECTQEEGCASPKELQLTAARMVYSIQRALNS